MTSSKLRAKNRRPESSEEIEQENCSELKLRRTFFASSDDEGFEDGQNRVSSCTVSNPTSTNPQFHGQSNGLPHKFQKEKYDCSLIPMGNSKQSNYPAKTDQQEGSRWLASPISTVLKPQKLKRRWLEAALVQTENDSLYLPTPQNSMGADGLQSSSNPCVPTSQFYARPSVLVMASSTINLNEMNQTKTEFETITLHKVQEGENLIDSSKPCSIQAGQFIKLENPCSWRRENSLNETANWYPSPPYKYNERRQDNHNHLWT